MALLLVAVAPAQAGCLGKLFGGRRAARQGGACYSAAGSYESYQSYSACSTGACAAPAAAFGACYSPATAGFSYQSYSATGYSAPATVQYQYVAPIAPVAPTPQAPAKKQMPEAPVPTPQVPGLVPSPGASRSFPDPIAPPIAYEPPSKNNMTLSAGTLIAFR